MCAALNIALVSGLVSLPIPHCPLRFSLTYIQTFLIDKTVNIKFNTILYFLLFRILVIVFISLQQNSKCVIASLNQSSLNKA